MKNANSALELIGNTPLLKLRKVTSTDANVYVKCEFLNPSGSIKDRMALRMVEEAEKSGNLREGETIIDETSGNTGPALAFVGSVKGYRIRLYIPAKWMSEYDPENRVRIMELFGAEVEAFSLKEYESLLHGLTPSEKSAAIFAIGMKKCYDLEKSDPMVWWSRQFCNPHNALAHKETTGREILKQLNNKVDAWVASIGTGGTLLGVAEALRAVVGGVKVIGLEPEDAQVTDWTRTGIMDKYQRALGLPKMKSIVDIMLEKGLPDEVFQVKDADARNMANRLCREEGLFCGISSGANVYAAIKVAENLGKKANVVTVLVDRRDRYFTEYPKEHYVI